LVGLATLLSWQIFGIKRDHQVLYFEDLAEKKYFEQDFGILFEDEQNLIGSSQMHLMGESARHDLVDIPIYFL
jgi:hypothetical protein